MNAPYKYDIVGSFLRDKEIKQAREEFALGKITLQQLEEVENKSIENLVNEEKTAGLKAGCFFIKSALPLHQTKHKQHPRQHCQ